MSSEQISNLLAYALGCAVTTIIAWRYMAWDKRQYHLCVMCGRKRDAICDECRTDRLGPRKPRSSRSSWPFQTLGGTSGTNPPPPPPPDKS